MGRIVTTNTARAQLTQSDIMTGIQRHQAGDWGDVAEPDRQANEHSLKEGHRLLSVYRASNGVQFWIITEADRSSSTVLLPEDY